MNIVSLIIQVISGAVGGNVAGAAMKESSLGTLGNSIAGIVGGGVGGTILQMGNGNRGGRRRRSRPAEHPGQRGRRRPGRSHPHGHRRHHQKSDGQKVAALTRVGRRFRIKPFARLVGGRANAGGGELSALTTVS